VVDLVAVYVPKRGDAIWINFHPQAGHEQAARRPAVVLSPGAYNGRVGLALLCPITNQRKDYPFEGERRGVAHGVGRAALL
jgi:mRNA interferase MazF